MGFIEASDIKRLLADPTLTEDIAKAVVEDSGALDDLAEDVADKMEDELQDDEDFKKKLLDAAMASPDFRKKVAKELVDDIG